MAVRPEDIEIVRRTWPPVARDLEGHGVVILKTFLDRYDYYSKFERFRDHPRDTIGENPIFRNHAYKVIKNIDDIINHLEDPAKLEQILSSLAKIHGRRKIEIQQFKHLQIIIVEILQGVFKISKPEADAWNRTLDAALSIVESLLQNHSQ